MDPDSSSPVSAPDAGRAERPVPSSLFVGCVLAWLGTLTSLLLLERHAGVRAFFCPVERGCETVLASQYAEFRGLPLPFFGAAFYLTMLAFLLAVYALPSSRKRLRLLDGALWMAFAGATFSAGLMYVQFGIIHAFCTLCTLSAMIMGGLLWSIVRIGRVLASAECSASPRGAITLGIFAILPAAILLTSALALPENAWPSTWIDLSTARFAGPRDARVQLVVFSDFQCPYCRQLAPVLKRIREEFPQEVLMAFRYYPLKAHPRAFPAAVAAECAADQGAFWEYHDQLFADGGDLSEERLVSLARGLNLDPKKFAACLGSEIPQRRVTESRKDAVAMQLKGVPAVFLNGRLVSGELDYENLTRQIRVALSAR